MANLRRRRSYRQIVNCDLELRPLMNVFIVLIPMLLLSAVFVEIRVIEMTLPRAADAATVAPLVEPFELAVRILADAYVVEANGAVIHAIPRRADPANAALPDAQTTTLLEGTLGGIVAAHPGHREVRIIAGAATRYQELVAVMDAARAAGLPEAALDGGGGD